MTVFFTGKGDGGRSSISKKTWPKHHYFFELLGSLDEINSALGVARAHASLKQRQIAAWILRAQEQLFIIQSEIAFLALGKKGPRLGTGHIDWLEEVIGKADKLLPELKKFVIPGADKAAAHIDLARAIARRVERAMSLNRVRARLPSLHLKYINRLSSFLFAIGRLATHLAGKREVNPKYK
jgi:cob(I)alamin adenosyltransferase